MRAAPSLLACLPLLLLGCAPPAPSQCPCHAASRDDHPAEPAHEPAPHAHPHTDASTESTAASASPATSAEPRVVPHAGLKTFENSGNSLVGLATRSLGSTQAEVWRSSIAVGSRTPLHTHDSEEIFIVLSGRGVVHVGDQALAFEAPATVIAPAGVPHWVENTGTVPTDQLVVVPTDSTIKSADGRVMDLPWRR